MASCLNVRLSYLHWKICCLVWSPSWIISARSPGELAAASTSAFAASPCTFILWGQLLPFNLMNQPLLASDFSSATDRYHKIIVRNFRLSRELPNCVTETGSEEMLFEEHCWWADSAGDQCNNCQGKYLRTDVCSASPGYELDVTMYFPS